MRAVEPVSVSPELGRGRNGMGGAQPSEFFPDLVTGALVGCYYLLLQFPFGQ